MKNMENYFKELNMAVTVCAADGTILYMNDRSVAVNGDGLTGSNVLECHPEPARSKLALLMEGRVTNAYTIEKNGVKKLIYQTPWFNNGIYAGFTEFSIEIPFDMPHFVRGTK